MAIFTFTPVRNCFRRKVYRLRMIVLRIYFSFYFLCIGLYRIATHSVNGWFMQHLPTPGGRRYQVLCRRFPKARIGLLLGAVTAVACSYIQVKVLAAVFAQLTGRALEPWGLDVQDEEVDSVRAVAFVVLFRIVVDELYNSFTMLARVTETAPITNPHLRGIVFGGLSFVVGSVVMAGLLGAMYAVCVGAMQYWRLTTGFAGLPAPMAQFAFVAAGLHVLALGLMGYMMATLDAKAKRIGKMVLYWALVFDVLALASGARYLPLFYPHFRRAWSVTRSSGFRDVVKVFEDMVDTMMGWGAWPEDPHQIAIVNVFGIGCFILTLTALRLQQAIFLRLLHFLWTKSSTLHRAAAERSFIVIQDTDFVLLMLGEILLFFAAVIWMPERNWAQNLWWAFEATAVSFWMLASWVWVGLPGLMASGVGEGWLWGGRVGRKQGVGGGAVQVKKRKAAGRRGR